MTSENYVRLRQICLAAANIGEAEGALTDILGLEVCHRSQLDQFGLENIMYAINGSFLEVVAPTRDNTAVDRFLARNQGRGGYMAIFDSANVARHKALAEASGVAPIFERYDDRADLLQLNPKATGATMLEFDHHKGGDDMMAKYHWAGEGWQEYVNTDVTGEITGIEIAGPETAARAKLWAQICDRPVSQENGVAQITLDYGRLRFVHNPGEKQDLFTAIDLTAKDPTAMRARAKKAGCTETERGFICYGVEFRPVRAD
ncbi:MAG: hypothetical protein CMN55_09475 [Sneathiella sp.]|jgi:hypothetical protein|uniref:VOC family protein n=1 Tax=Sneathiella sp. TaxID=1964365 RepID=UPI000C4D98B1|nr:VOC family protein [Sneathiella sp.]MAL79326.1 hypothetical protein [Sneathiella sp.]